MCTDSRCDICLFYRALLQKRPRYIVISCFCSKWRAHSQESVCSKSCAIPWLNPLLTAATYIYLTIRSTNKYMRQQIVSICRAYLFVEHIVKGIYMAAVKRALNQISICSRYIHVAAERMYQYIHVAAERMYQSATCGSRAYVSVCCVRSAATYVYL